MATKRVHKRKFRTNRSKSRSKTRINRHNKSRRYKGLSKLRGG